MSNHNNQRGFTLVELIMVIVIMGVIGGIVSVFMKSPIDAYFASARRAALTDVADTVVRRMARDIQRALPNSIRTPNNLCVEFIPTKTGGRYRADDTAAGLSFTTADGSFNMLGSNTLFAGNTIPRDSIPADQQIANGDVIVVYNLGIPDSDAYQLTARVNTARVTAIAPSGTASSPETTISIVSTLAPNGDILFPLASGSNRFHVVRGSENVVSYVCDLTSRQMFRTVSTFANEPTDSCNSSGTLHTGSSRSVLASNISDCSFDYTGSDLQRNALISMRLQLTDASGESVTLQHEVHVSNTP